LAAGTAAKDLSVGWVVDATKQSPAMLRNLADMKSLIDNGQLTIPSSCPRRVDSASDALQEALYYLAQATASSKTQCCALDDARAILAGLTVDQWRMNDLDHSVQLLAGGAFASGTGLAILKHIEGELTDRICRYGSAEYSTQGLLDTLKTGRVVLAAPADLARLLRFHSAAGLSLDIPIVKWARLEGEPTKEWSLQERLPELRQAESCVILAAVGVGKSVSSQQAFRDQSRLRDPHHVLRFTAGSVDRAQLDAILQLACILSGIAPTWISIDGMDEVAREQRESWQRTIYNLLALPNLTLVLTAREEVLLAHQWLQKLTDVLRSVPLRPLSVEQVQDAFRDARLPVPRSSALVQVLQTAFLFSLYAKVVTPHDIPLSDSGEVTAFQVIEAFWNRAVTAESSGQRLVGEEHRSQQAKREALAYLVEQSLGGAMAIPRGGIVDRVSDGIEMLVREGMLLPQGNHAVQWVHDWVKEYALVDFLASKISHPSASNLVAAIGELRVDYVARTAAIAGLKWTIAHPRWGAAQEYVVEIWNTHRGLAREVLIVLIEGSSSLLRLESLPLELLIEGIEQAVVIRAAQWEPQIMDLPMELFGGRDGAKLNDVVSRYGLEISRI